MPLQILVTDDDFTIRRLIKDCLELHGYSVILASDGEEALSLANKYHPHLLISDIKMPNKDGYHLVKELRENPNFRLLPVIFLTHKNTTEDKIHGYQAGGDIYLAKPFQPNELTAIVRHLLEKTQIIQSELLFTEINHNYPQPVSNLITNNRDKIAENNIYLTKREIEVLELLIKGLSNLKIANKLYLSPKTIEKYVSSLLKKTNSNNRTELANFVFKNKIL
ncbi:MAG: response regulator transcription factor [Cyanobacteria bacterium]|nr:response regulator transcription factor [Cyanobacteria bacterium CG_2015-16_32_12]NCO78180.1 response regulator transcription factor [Cyanobacteria bacterium CG_2015-22_32_23]NCQ04750.1 response regulator transcription factor [Cyanobacteria bacterium CG_2015-09_32_10]NCQ40319.1 response regulator transcription factor [Cyanobacteria bacterium CG_2015-04_32_10]NCS84881.1 response regulator transcription factor [Cyanobacteria bacterium CG_2015-02_32_10]